MKERDKLYKLACGNPVCGGFGVVFELTERRAKCFQCGRRMRSEKQTEGSLSPSGPTRAWLPKTQKPWESLPSIYQLEVNQKPDYTFTCEADLTERCPVAKKPHINVRFGLYVAWLQLARQFDTEWLAYLKGQKSETGEYLIEDMYFPPQEASGSYVSSIEPETILFQPGTIGALHSHVGMEAFFSGTDQEHANWPVEIVINRAGDMKAVARLKLDCGRWAKTDAKVHLIGATADQMYHQQLTEAFEKGKEARSNREDDELLLGLFQ